MPFSIPPFELPGADETADVEALATSPAVQLFVARAVGMEPFMEL